jgi:hypothetical protein
MELIEINTTDIVLQDFGQGKGKIIISDTDRDYNFSFYWGAMGKDTTLREFIKEIDSSYFIGKLAHHCQGKFSSKRTFSKLRKFLREEYSEDLAWYKNMEFQKELRHDLNRFQEDCGSEEMFVFMWDSFADNLHYYLIDNELDRKQIESIFKGMCEVWHFIEKDTPAEHIWLERLHKELKNIL